MNPGKKSLMVTLFLFILIVFIGSAYATKSVYVISDTTISRVKVYKVEGAGLVWQKDYICQSAPGGGAGAVAMAIDRGIRNFPPELRAGTAWYA